MKVAPLLLCVLAGSMCRTEAATTDGGTAAGGGAASTGTPAAASAGGTYAPTATGGQPTSPAGDRRNGTTAVGKAEPAAAKADRPNVLLMLGVGLVVTSAYVTVLAIGCRLARRRANRAQRADVIPVAT